jgi:hypothetical protein
MFNTSIGAPEIVFNSKSQLQANISAKNKAIKNAHFPVTSKSSSKTFFFYYSSFEEIIVDFRINLFIN